MARFILGNRRRHIPTNMKIIPTGFTQASIYPAASLPDALDVVRDQWQLYKKSGRSVNWKHAYSVEEFHQMLDDVMFYFSAPKLVNPYDSDHFKTRINTAHFSFCTWR